MRLNILIACEESQAIANEFRKLGHRAFSCDLQSCSGGHPEWHIMGDCLPLLPGRCTFLTSDGKQHQIKGKWDIVIGHPPCTYISMAGANRMFHPPGIINQQRFKLAMQAKEFFLSILHCDCERVAIENPTPLHCVELPKPSCVIQPYEFGDPYCKRTLLWLRNLPPLIPTCHVVKYRPWVQAHSGGFQANTPKMRSKTFPGIAREIARQWSAFVIAEKKQKQSKNGDEVATQLGAHSGTYKT